MSLTCYRCGAWPCVCHDELTLLHGDCVATMAELPESSVTAIVCDPPYMISFMSKNWDTAGVAFDVATWAAALRVAKPGAPLLAFGGDRTHHRLMVAIEDAGWEIRTCVYWVTGSGFPKSLSISKQLDKEEQRRWLKISNGVDSLDVAAIIEAWKEHSKTAKSAGLSFGKSQTETGTNTPKSGSVLGAVQLRASPKSVFSNVVIAELKSSALRPTLAENEPSVLLNADRNTSRLQPPVESVENRPPWQEAGSSESITVHVDAKEWQSESTTNNPKAAEALKTWLGSKPSSKAADSSALCAALTDDLKRITLSQSKTFQSFDTTKQTECASAINVTITESTAASLISFTADTLKREAIDKAAGAEREVVRHDARPETSGTISGASDTRPWIEKSRETGFHECAGPVPITDAAKTWEGYGTALKPATEIAVLCQKPLTEVPFNGRLLVDTQHLLGGLLCLLLSNAKNAELISKLSPAVQGEVSASALMLAAVLHGDESGGLSEAMGMCNSPETVPTCLNIARLWSNILAVVLKHGNTYTTRTATALTTALQTLNCLLSTNIPDAAIQAVSRPFGLPSLAPDAEKSSSDVKLNTENTRRRFAAVLVSLDTDSGGTSARNAAETFRAVLSTVNSVLNHALTSIATESGIRQDTESVSDAENGFESSSHGQPSTAEESAWRLGTLKPEVLPIVLAMKPLDGTFAHNAVTHGVAGLNIDGCRVGTEQIVTSPRSDDLHAKSNSLNDKWSGKVDETPHTGRWPATLCHDGSAEAVAGFPETGGDNRTSVSGTRQGGFGNVGAGGSSVGPCSPVFPDSGSAARYFYCAKAGADERGDSRHPTIKPRKLMEYLCKLVKMPAGNLILDPFCGTGSTLEAARNCGMAAIGIEQNHESCDDTVKRLESGGLF